MTLNKYYRNALMIPSGFAIAFNLIYSIILLIVDRDYKSEWLTIESVFFVSIVMVTLNAAFVCGLSLPIFLNKYEKVKNNLLLSLLSWFLLPGIWIGYVLVKHGSYLVISGNGLDTESVFVLSNTIPFLIGLIYTFVKFQLGKTKYNDLRKTENSD